MSDLLPVYFLSLLAEFRHKITEDMFPIVVVDVHLLRIFFATNELLGSCGLAIFCSRSEKGAFGGLYKF